MQAAPSQEFLSTGRIWGFGGCHDNGTCPTTAPNVKTDGGGTGDGGGGGWILSRWGYVLSAR